MATRKDSGPHSRQRKIDSWDPQKEEVHSVTLFLEVTDQPKMAPTGQGCLEAETVPAFRVQSNFLNHESSGSEGNGFGRER